MVDARSSHTASRARRQPARSSTPRRSETCRRARVHSVISLDSKMGVPAMVEAGCRCWCSLTDASGLRAGRTTVVQGDGLRGRAAFMGLLQTARESPDAVDVLDVFVDRQAAEALAPASPIAHGVRRRARTDDRPTAMPPSGARAFAASVQADASGAPRSLLPGGHSLGGAPRRSSAHAEAPARSTRNGWLRILFCGHNTERRVVHFPGSCISAVALLRGLPARTNSGPRRRKPGRPAGGRSSVPIERADYESPIRFPPRSPTPTTT